METSGRLQRGLGTSSLLLCGWLSLAACSSPVRDLSADSSGAAGQGAGGTGAAPSSIGGSAGSSGSLSRGGNSNVPNAGSSGKLETGGTAVAGDGTGGAAGNAAGNAAGGASAGAAGDVTAGAGKGGLAALGGGGSGGAIASGGAAGCQGSACTSAVCGDNVKASTEQCDDGNTTTEACAYGLKSCMVCGAACKDVAGSVSYCGDGAVRAGYETCDDSNTTTESCTYGQSSCSVCDATCHTVAGAISYCGDSVLQSAREACDNGTSNSTSGNCSPTCTTCDKVPGTEPLTYDDTSWTGGLSFTVTKATTLYQFKVYHNDSSYQLNLYKLSAADTAPAATATPLWKQATSTPKASTFDTINVSLPLAVGSYLLTTVGQVMGISVPNPAVAYPVQSLSGIKVTKSFSVQDTLELNQGTFRTTSWGPFTDLRSCLQSPN